MAAARPKQESVASLLSEEGEGDTEPSSPPASASVHAKYCKAVKLVSMAEEMNARFRHTMEDAHVVVDKYSGDEGTAFLGVYDGHGGSTIANYLRDNLHEVVEKELKEKASRSVEECLKSAFLLTDIAANETKEEASGATAVVCIIRQAGSSRYVYAANCGDARAVLCHNGAAVRLTKDHKADDPEEVNRIEAAGGFILRKRVMGVLAVARSFGDFSLKKFVTAEPYTTTTKLDGSSDFIIVACDGVWDVLSDQDAVDIVRQCAGKEQAKKLAAGALVNAALSAGSTDNVTAMVCWL